MGQKTYRRSIQPTSSKTDLGNRCASAGRRFSLARVLSPVRKGGHHAEHLVQPGLMMQRSRSMLSFFRRWFRSPPRRTRRPSVARRPQGTRLFLEALEDRMTPTVVNLTSTGSSGSLLGAQFIQGVAGPAGTGVIQSFVRIEKDGVEQGYNTSSRPVQFDEKTDPNYTRSFLLGAAA